jgi:methenyltetrahydromethanopterin cyclohydrolase
MSFIVFILLGLAVCGFTHALFNTRAVMVDLGVAVIGAVMAGALLNHIAATGAGVLSITDALVAAGTGAVALVAASHATLRCARYRRHRAS